MIKAMNMFGILALLIVVVALLFSMQQLSPQTSKRTVLVGSTTLAVDVAETPAARAQGLSGRAELKDGKGMLFIFEQEGNWGIWMKDMRFALDIIWAASDGTIITVARNVGPETYPQAFYPAEPRAKYVLEVPAGFAEREGIAEGAKLTF
jgi:uncharacterized membrane protein (UPF0127 family)